MQVKEELYASTKSSYLKEVINEQGNKHFMYFVNKNVLLSKNMLKEMEKYIYLEFCYRFNQPVDNLPSNIQYIKFGSSFDKPVDNLPKGLETLILSETYKKPLNNLPVSVKIIRIKYS